MYDEEKVIYLLKNEKKLIKSYYEEENRLVKKLETVAETVEGITLKSKELKEFIISKTNVNTDPVFNVLETAYRERERMVSEYVRRLNDV